MTGHASDEQETSGDAGDTPPLAAELGAALLNLLQDAYARFRVPVTLAVVSFLMRRHVGGRSGQVLRPEGSSETSLRAPLPDGRHPPA